jgi:3-oxoacyl-[acyl-carrier protein] reductase
MDLKLHGKVAIVTGAGRGIGRGIAQQLAAEGAAVVMSSRDRSEIEEAAAAIVSARGAAIGVAADATDPTSAQTLVDRAVERFGTIHILVNNVGGVGEYVGFEELSDAQWLRMFELNVMTGVRMIRAVHPVMAAQKWGRIINIGSENGTQPEALAPHYNAAKAATINLGKSLSRAFAADGILVNTVSPAMILTPHAEAVFRKMAAAAGSTPQEEEEKFVRTKRTNIVVGRSGRIEEVAAVVAFLASEAASFVTGSNYRVDGGSVASL